MQLTVCWTYVPRYASIGPESTSEYEVRHHLMHTPRLGPMGNWSLVSSLTAARPVMTGMDLTCGLRLVPS